MRLIVLLNLIRWKNLLTAFATWTLFHTWVISDHLLLPNGIAPALNLVTSLLVGITIMLVMAGGNIYNDLVDLRVDATNRPDRGLPSGQIPVKKAWLLLSLCYNAAMLLAFGLSVATGRWLITLVTALAALLLILYSKYLKCSPLIGNIAIAALIAFVPFYAYAVEIREISELGDVAPDDYVRLVSSIGLFTFLAFGINFIREFVKDMEDIAGDKTQECRTFPVVAGLKTSSLIIRIIIVVYLVAFLALLYGYRPGAVVWIVGIAGVAVPLAYIAAGINPVSAPARYRQFNNILKLIMLAGLGLFALMTR